jgi:hypothetical protein
MIIDVLDIVNRPVFLFKNTFRRPNSLSPSSGKKPTQLSPIDRASESVIQGRRMNESASHQPVSKWVSNQSVTQPASEESMGHLVIHC